MSPHFPVCNARDVVRALRQHGFVLAGQSGSHQKWRHPNGRQVIVAVHGNKPIPIGTLKSIVEASGLDPEEFR
ncbi:MAG: type II toxin-antitoxin system HicA family toxin [Burkholderiales bacterium]|nr:type II toxin-antitoxin system HicA family toxin [Burkholderiales bacterium]